MAGALTNFLCNDPSPSRQLASTLADLHLFWEPPPKRMQNRSTSLRGFILLRFPEEALGVVVFSAAYVLMHASAKPRAKQSLCFLPLHHYSSPGQSWRRVILFPSRGLRAWWQTCWDSYGSRQRVQRRRARDAMTPERWGEVLFMLGRIRSFSVACMGLLRRSLHVGRTCGRIRSPLYSLPTWVLHKNTHTCTSVQAAVAATKTCTRR